MRLRCLGHLLDHPRQSSCAGAGSGLPLPEPAARPGLQNRHADKEQAHHAQDHPAQPGCRPIVLGQGDEYPGQTVEQHGPGGPEQPG